MVGSDHSDSHGIDDVLLVGRRMKTTRDGGLVVVLPDTSPTMGSLLASDGSEMGLSYLLYESAAFHVRPLKLKTAEQADRDDGSMVVSNPRDAKC